MSNPQDRTAAHPVLGVMGIIREGDRVLMIRRSATVRVPLAWCFPGGAIYGVKAISPSGQLHDVKGVKVLKEPVEATVNGVAVRAHVKALPQVSEPTGHSAPDQ